MIGKSSGFIFGLTAVTLLALLFVLFLKIQNIEQTLTTKNDHGNDDDLVNKLALIHQQISLLGSHSDEQNEQLLQNIKKIIDKGTKNAKDNGGSCPSCPPPGMQYGCANRPHDIPCTKDCNAHFEAWSETGPELCEFINLKNFRTFNYRLGIASHETDGGGMFALSHADQLVVDYILTRFKFADITELGTAAGVSSLFFGMVARTRGGTAHTYDFKDIRDSRVKRGWLDNMVFYREDILTTVNQKVIDSLQRSVQFAFFDNGSKKKEINVYARYLPAGSVLATHDWDNELFLRDVSATLNEHGFEPLFENMALDLRSHVRAWKKTK